MMCSCVCRCVMAMQYQGGCALCAAGPWHGHKCVPACTAHQPAVQELLRLTLSHVALSRPSAQACTSGGAV